MFFHKQGTNNTTIYFSRQSQSSVKHTPGKGSVDPEYPFQPSRAVDHHEVSKFLSKQLSLDRELLKSLRWRNCFLQRSCGKLQTPCHWLWHVPNLQRKLVEGLHAILSECVRKIKNFMMSCTGRTSLKGGSLYSLWMPLVWLLSGCYKCRIPLNPSFLCSAESCKQ